MPDALETLSGTFAKKKPTTAGMPTLPPLIRLMPMTIDSGMLSRSAPAAIATPLPFCSASVACCTQPPHRFRFLAPCCDRNQFTVQNISAPTRKLAIAEIRLPCSAASFINSNASTESRTPPPNPITEEITRCDNGIKYDIAAPTSNPAPESNPHPAACNHIQSLLFSAVLCNRLKTCKHALVLRREGG